MAGQKKFVYILNHYSKDSDQHLFHVINLLKKIADKGVKIALIIERCEDEPGHIHDNISVYGQKQKKGFRRAWELRSIIKKRYEEGYKKIFIRISTKAAAVAIICAKKHNVETFFWHSGMGFDMMRGGKIAKRISWYLRDNPLFCYVKNNIDYFTTGPETMIDYYCREANVARKKLKLLYNDVDIMRFYMVGNDEKHKLREKYNLENYKLYILFVHRFSPIRKTLYYFPYIPERLNREDIAFLLIGTGPEEHEVKLAVKKSGLKNVFFFGAIPNAQIQEYYSACDIFFNPSYCEGFPRVIIEAMACGMPVVSTDAGGTMDLFGDYQRNFVVPVDDRDLLCEKLSQMIDDKAARERCSQENLSRVVRYSTDAVADMYIHLLFGR